MKFNQTAFEKLDAIVDDVRSASDDFEGAFDGYAAAEDAEERGLYRADARNAMSGIIDAAERLKALVEEVED